MNKFRKYSGIKLILIGVFGFIIDVILHNGFYALTGIEEPVFFLLAVIVSPIIIIFGIIKFLIKLIK